MTYSLQDDGAGHQRLLRDGRLIGVLFEDAERVCQVLNGASPEPVPAGRIQKLHGEVAGVEPGSITWQRR